MQLFPNLKKGYILRNESVVHSRPLKVVVMVKVDFITASLSPYASSNLCLTNYDNKDNNNKDKRKLLTMKSQITLFSSYLDPCKAWHCCLSCMS